MEKKILHIITNDKFSDYAIKQFSTPEMCSEFVLIPVNEISCETEIKHMASVIVMKPDSDDYINLLHRLGDYSCVILHGLFWGNWQSRIIETVPSTTKLAWVFWGGELYNRSDLRSTFLAPITKLLCDFRSIFKGKQPSCHWQIPIEQFRRIDYCITSLEEEYEFAYKYIGNPDLKHIWYAYYSIEDTIGTELMKQRCSGDNIWFCNSVAENVNIFDGLCYLRRPCVRKDIKKSKIITPVSYGEPWVRNIVLKWGERLFGDNFMPLKHYLPREEYNSMMLSCSTMILPYLEPAAHGNILTALWLGMRVYLSEKSMSYTYFTRIGCKVYSIEYDLVERADRFMPQTDVELKQNRKVLLDLYGREHTMQMVRETVQELSTPKTDN